MEQLNHPELDKVLELLHLPQDMEQFTGQVNTCTRYSLVENRLIDYTYVNDKFKREIKTTSTFSSVAKTIDLGAYNHNLLSSYVHSYGFDPLGLIGSEYRMDKDGITFTATQGPLAGNTYYIGWGEVTITPTADGFDMRVENEPWINVNSDGTPVVSPKVSITRLTTTKTGLLSIIPSKKQVTVSNVKLSGPTKSYPSYTQTELETLTGWDEYQIAKAMATVFHMKKKDVSTHCVALGTDIDINGTELTGVVYINGFKSNEISYQQLTSSFGKKLTDFVTRWKVYHPSNTTGSEGYGTALPVIQNLSHENNTITIVKGDKLAYEASTRTLTFIDGTRLIFDFEFLPAQGKNETWGSTLDLDTMVEDIYQ
jgi:hypothetical protein